VELSSTTGTARAALQDIYKVNGIVASLFSHDWLHALSSEIDFYTVACNTFELHNAFVVLFHNQHK